MSQPSSSSTRTRLAAEAKALIQATGLRKSYGGVRALDGVSVDIRAGEVHGLVGANGAGKSTLIRILAGLVRPDAGRIRVDGEAISIETPDHATALGFSFIHQELALVPRMTALGNIVLGFPKPQRLGLVDWRRLRDLVEPLARRVGIRFSLDTQAATLVVGERWLVSITGAGCGDQHRYVPLGAGVGSAWDQLLSFDRLEQSVGGDRSRIIILHDETRWSAFKRVHEIEGLGIYKVA